MTRRTLLVSAVPAAFVETAAPDWIAWNLTSGLQQSCSWPDPGTPVSPGSLLKPFLVLSYAATHDRFPISNCRGHQSGCWRTAGHGSQDVVAALANSCNAYFLQLASAVNRAALDAVSLRYGLQLPARSAQGRQLIGLDEGWPQAPVTIARAFCELMRNHSEQARSVVLAGMARCARAGTAREIGFECYAKTGTGPCTHSRRGEGDGFVVAIYPPAEPRRVLLARRHNTTGAITARDAARIRSIVN